MASASSRARGVRNPLERAVQPFPGKGVAFAQFHMQIADQIQLIRVVGQLGFRAPPLRQFVPEAEDILRQAGALRGVLQGLPRAALVIAVIDVVEIAGAGLVQIVKQAEKGHPRRVRTGPGEPGRNPAR